MKKIIYSFSLVVAVLFSACNGSNITGGATRDSSASHGYSGASDNTNAPASGSAVGATPMGTDTSKTGQSTTEPTVDTAKKKKP